MRVGEDWRLQERETLLSVIRETPKVPFFAIALFPKVM